MPFQNAASVRRLQVLLLILLPMLLCGALALLRGNDVGWDQQNYHLYNAHALLESRHTLDLMPAGAQTWFNPLLDTFYFLTATRWDLRIAAFLVGMLQGANFALVYYIARHTLPGKAPLHLLCATLGVLGTGFLVQVGTTLNDALIAAFPLGALLLLLRAGDAAARRRDALVVLAGVLAGTGCSLKLVVATNALALCLALLLTTGGPFRERLRAAFLFGLAVLAAIAVVGGWWLLRVWELQGNPLFPQFNNVFEGAFATAEANKDARYLPRSWVEALFWPFIFTLDPFRAGEILVRPLPWPMACALLFMLGAQRLLPRVRARVSPRPEWSLTILARFPRVPAGAAVLSPPQRLLLVYVIIAYLLWLQLFGIYRYLVPLELLLPLVILVVARALRDTVAIKAGALAALLAATVHGLGTLPDSGRGPWHEQLYRVEAPADEARVNAVVLMGQPLAWLVPALDWRVPFIQGHPNFATTQAYWRHALALAGKNGGLRVIFDPAVVDERTVAQRLAWFDFRLRTQDCRPLRAWLGGTPFTYAYCPFEK